MSTTNTVVADAVAAFNQVKKEEVQYEAERLIGCIAEQDTKITEAENRAKAHQKALNEVSADVIDEATVFGGSVPSNPNHDTIVAVIEKANQNRQHDIEQRTARLTSAFVAEQDAIKALQKKRAELVEQLTKLSAPSLTIEQVMG